ncbi:hypothetical protein GCM10009841_23900 [Microlunatus panaciterrae]|uniref:Secreted protein n=1 Tax=Microlunatus panaciterrae TaxID=400768 RepID=A0ABS2RE49_9ACTN|nr:DUF6167 family protein [Microlunatus panaciterrae]MBM7797271.1 hypothetical protein [Microlunatus panaciterrae]
MRRLFWFTVGAGVGIYGLVKLRQYLQQASPEALGHRVAESASGVRESIREFNATVRAAMVEREAELRDAVGLPENDN